MAPQTPEIEATRLRGDTWGEGRYPVDPVRIAHELGIDVRQSFLSPNVSGALIKEVGQDPVILLNANDSRNRQRFTCAHELGHFVARQNANGGSPDEYEYIDLRDTVWSASAQIPSERWANQFAANLLMPSGEVKRLAGQGKTVTQMAIYFDVSVEAMTYRLKNLGLS